MLMSDLQGRERLKPVLQSALIADRPVAGLTVAELREEDSPGDELSPNGTVMNPDPA
jgi:hypothetical protein